MLFHIQWRNPETQAFEEEFREFNDTPTVTAVLWAEDYAYSLADKGWFCVTPVKTKSSLSYPL